jgi:hypothetical protein
MRKQILVLGLSTMLTYAGFAQQLANKDIPAPVKASFEKNYAQATKVTWEKEKGNYEANWGGKSGEDNSVLFSPSGNFIEIVTAMQVSNLPSSINLYVKAHYNGAKITEAGKVKDAKGKQSYEIEVNKKDLIFTEKGEFVKAGD